MTGLTADDTYLNFRNTQEVDKAHQKVVRMWRTEFANLPNKILLVPGMITSNVIVGVVNGAVGTRIAA